MRILKKLLILVITVAVVFCICWSPFVHQHFIKFDDIFYQQEGYLGKDIVIIGIDDDSLEQYGLFTEWSRRRIGDLLKLLSSSENCVIGVDILFTGTSKDDKYLTECASSCDNVYLACLAKYDTVFTKHDGRARLVSGVVNVEYPYEELCRSIDGVGHINAVIDDDGVLRNHLLTVGDSVPSLSYVIAKRYSELMGYNFEANNSDKVWYIDFQGKPGLVEEHSIVDVLNGSIKPSYFDNKVVLIGPYASGMQDSYITSMEHNNLMYGVEVHANIISALLNNRQKVLITTFESVLYLLLLFLVLAIFCYCAEMWQNFLVQFCLFCLCVLCCRYAYSQGYVLPLSQSIIGIGFYFVIAIGVHYKREYSSRKVIETTFNKYVAPEIVKEILKKDPEELTLCGEEVDIAVLFVDIRGFTTMSESLEPTQVVNILNRYLTVVSNAIFACGGTLDKFIGDATMAFWGAPLACEDSVLCAAKAAILMKEKSNALTKECEELYGKSVSFGIGIHYGKAVVGNIGSNIRMDYTAIGDTVNTASRLESNAPRNTIYISRTVADILGERGVTESLGSSIKLKGKAEGFEILLLKELKE